jgi:RNA polymerase sigma-70 factor (ECF subfamily)
MSSDKMPNQDVAEKDLLQNLKRGDASAFRKLVEQHQERVRNTCYRFVNNKEDAEDVAQDVFVEVYRSVKHFRKDAQLSTWIYRIAVNKSLDYVRRKKRKKSFGQVLSFFGVGEEEKGLQLPSGEDPHADLERQERTRTLNLAIDTLPENQKVAITLSKYEGLRNSEIAEVMETSLSAVESLIHRAKENLHQRLYSYYSEHM